MDSPAAQARSEPRVSHEIDATIHSHPDGSPALLVGEEMAKPLRGGTTGSNPSCSSGGSDANWSFGEHHWGRTEAATRHFVRAGRRQSAEGCWPRCGRWWVK